ncbi:YggN family protein [Pseudoalteromonas luteoviolacea]|uniref:DUF2884 family protein n=1 Tax=Pseudoalteromonas luteoviolacea S4054 TaxID=1129367 RepID=A0A0F6AHQ2_9GAMM|nr:YggN family protein [Pseudoalteromonas luteoviolacea]AOT10012.1 hypothetical protein S4054249_20300 [Pseudoalteromonas luteoviolacea]AOT14923.1 hypothetical protein S40542_20270 [Pseudoalteromonas luteoviolacea]AOT19839.1 hypothetical protein S4054_20275 [Pseudoalteromonas luteoviolacea]KKE84909.1 hypothetical protein N479_07375 [Pseudoalteromonas luteoviolacea S4054]KZN72526.1 hypothetical protein N481_14965 [Pseudoalteromonas luteoviolacea S4047-1]
MKTTLLSIAILSSASAYAHTDHHFSITHDDCQLQFQNDVKISPEDVSITQANNQHMLITADGNLLINGQTITVTPEQQQALSNYADTLRVELPKVAEVATEAVTLAGVALDEVATTFNLHSLDELSGVLEELNEEVHNTFYQDGSFVMGEQTMDNFGERFGHEFESRIESAVKSAMFESIGTLLISLGSEMKNTNGDINTFEQRMEQMGENIEQRVTAQADQLEARADALCQQFTQIAQQEARLSHSIPTLSGYALMRQNQY